MTLAVHHRRSIARFGDGELRIAIGDSAVSQKPDKTLAAELRHALGRDHDVLTCIPHLQSPKYGKTWYKYNMDQYIRMYTRDLYGSAFISRPDSAPWIDTPEYWSLVRDLWRDKDVVLVIGTENSLTQACMPEAKSVQVIEGPRRDAYDHIDDLMKRIGDPGDRPVLLCLGACATVLAVRLHQTYRAHALDLGHIGRPIRKPGRWANRANG